MIRRPRLEPRAFVEPEAQRERNSCTTLSDRGLTPRTAIHRPLYGF